MAIVCPYSSKTRKSLGNKSFCKRRIHCVFTALSRTKLARFGFFNLNEFVTQKIPTFYARLWTRWRSVRRPLTDEQRDILKVAGSLWIEDGTRQFVVSVYGGLFPVVYFYRLMMIMMINLFKVLLLTKSWVTHQKVWNWIYPLQKLYEIRTTP